MLDDVPSLLRLKSSKIATSKKAPPYYVVDLQAICVQDVGGKVALQATLSTTLSLNILFRYTAGRNKTNAQLENGFPRDYNGKAYSGDLLKRACSIRRKEMRTCIIQPWLPIPSPLRCLLEKTYDGETLRNGLYLSAALSARIKAWWDNRTLLCLYTRGTVLV